MLSLEAKRRRGRVVGGYLAAFFRSGHPPALRTHRAPPPAHR